MKTKIKGLIAILFCVILVISVGLTASAEDPNSTDLVVIKRALFEQIEYDPLWLDINSDGECNILDLVHMKKYLIGVYDEIVQTKYIDVTFVDDSSTVVQRLYQAKCLLPEINSDNLYWRVGTQYYNPKNTITLKADTVFTAVKSKKDVDFPIIDF